MARRIIVVVLVMLVAGVSFAQGTANVAGIKPSDSQSPVKAYDVPFVATAQKADGTGPVEIVTYQKVTKQQLQSIITNATSAVARMQKQVADAQAQLDKIVELEAKPAE